MKRMATVLGIYVVLLAVMVIVMTWVTLRTLDLEHEERLTTLSAENERLALWRMESMLLPLILEESSRDYSTLAPLTDKIPPDGPGTASNASSNGIPFGDSVYVACYFQCDATGRFRFRHSSRTENQPTVSADPLKSLVSGVRHQRLFALLREIQPLPGQPDDVEIAQQEPPARTLAESNPPHQQANPDPRQVPILTPPQIAAQSSQIAQLQVQQQTRSFAEFQNRINVNTSNTGQNFRGQFQRLTLDGRNRSSMPLSQSEINTGPMTIFWLDDQLFLARLVRPAKDELVQGCLLDWKELSKSLTAHVSDLLSEAQLVPIPVDEEGDHLSLATIPAQLIPGPTVLPDQPPWSSMRVSLAVAWGWLLLSAVAIGALLFGVVRLSERRASFVSAVTHELRTPLTTFQLYSDLLANRDALTDEKHTRYVDTLRVEAERLGHLIENVLSWSRLDQSADTELIETVAWSDLLSRIEPSLNDRAEQAGMTLETDCLGEDSEMRFRGNRTAVERILFNLIDNACKYAKPADDKRIHLDVAASDAVVSICVRDHGPGVPDEIRSILFKPFTKSATDAARSAAGVGLGLSLCRRLARNMNGDLTLQDSSHSGTTFQLRLPVL